MTARYLIDKSALARARLDPVWRRLGPILEAREAATCSIVDLEVLFSARGPEEHARIRRRRELSYSKVPLTQTVFDRAVEVQGDLAKSRRHRVPIPDLIVAAAAESASLTLLHYDADFDLIAEATGQPTEWVVPRGSL